MNSYAVLSGDVIDSGELLEQVDYGDRLDEAFEQFESSFAEQLVLKPDRYEGDRFQILMDDVSRSPRSALFLYTRLALGDPPIHVRLSLGLGGVESMPDRRVSEGDGNAFRLSGNNLASMSRHQRIMVEGSDEVCGDRENRLLAGASDLLSAVLTDLSRQQAEAVWYRLQEFSQQAIADRIGIRQQTVSDRLTAAYWPSLASFLERFEESFR